MSRMLAAALLFCAFLSLSVVPVVSTTAPVVGQTANIHLWQTSDIHGWVDGHDHGAEDATIASLLALVEHKKAAIAKEDNVDFLLFDSGDQVQGTGLSDATEIDGELIFHAMGKYLPYDGLGVGNHELGLPTTVQYLKDRADDIWPEDRYITTNTLWNTEDATEIDPLGQSRYRLITLPGTGMKVLVLGWIYNFSHPIQHVHIVDAVEVIRSDWFNQTLEATQPDLIVHLCHISTDDPQNNEIFRAVRELMPRTPMVLLTGHSHRLRHAECVYADGGTDTQCIMSEPACYLKQIVELPIQMVYKDTPSGPMWRMAALPIPHPHHATQAGLESLVDTRPFMTANSTELQEYIDAKEEALGLSSSLGCSPDTYKKSQPPWGPDADVSFIGLFQHSILPTMIYRTPAPGHEIISIMNSGTLRADMHEGDVTLADLYTIMPFQDHYYSLDGLNGTEVHALVDLAHAPIPPRWHAPTAAPTLGMPHFILSMSKTDLDPHKTYTVVCTAYDSGTFVEALKAKYPTRTPEYATTQYSTMTTFGSFQGFVEAHMPCTVPPVNGGPATPTWPWLVALSFGVGGAFIAAASCACLGLTLAGSFIALKHLRGGPPRVQHPYHKSRYGAVSVAENLSMLIEDPIEEASGDGLDTSLVLPEGLLA